MTQIQLHASALNRVVNCNGSVTMSRMSEVPEDKEQSDDQRDGDAAHWLAIEALRTGKEPSEFIDTMAFNGVYVTSEMVEAVGLFVDAINERGFGVVRFLERNADYELTNTTRILARPDVVTWGNGVLCIDDFKYGWRIVEPHDNWTLIAYVMSAIRMIDGEVPTTIQLTIHQPRPHHENGKTRTWTLTYAEWYEWFKRLIVSVGHLSDDLHTGPHCYKCPALAHCAAIRNAGYNAIDTSHMVFNDKLNDDEIERERIEILRAIERLEQRGNAITELMMHRIENGAIYQNHYIERNEGHAKFNPGLKPAIIKQMTGIDISTTGMLTPAQAIKKGVPESVVKAFSFRPKLAAKLVNKSAAKRAEKLFGKTPKGN